MSKGKLKTIFIIILVVIALIYYFYFGVVKCQHNLWLDWIGEIVGISCSQ